MSNPRPRTGLATLALLGATAVWGATFVSVKDALQGADAATFLALRFTVGAFAAGLLAIPRASPDDWRRSLRPGLGLGLLLFGGYLLQTLGLETTTPARSAFVTGLTVLFVPFTSWWVAKRRPDRRAFVAPLLALAGLQRLTGVGWGDALPMGDVLTLGCAVLYAWHITLMGRWAPGVQALTLTTVQLGVVAVASAATAWWRGPRLEPTPAFWGAVLFTGVVASAVAIAVQVWAQTQVSAVRAAVIYALEPVFALAWAAVQGLGTPSSPELLGGALILLAVLVSEVRWGAPPPPTAD